MRKFILAASTAAVAFAGVTTASAQDKVTLRFLTAWDDRFVGTKFVAHLYGKLIEKESKGRITVKFSGPEVVKPRQQFQPVSAGAFDMHLNTPAYSLGTTGVMFAMYALPADTERWHKNGYWAYLDKELQHFNQKAIALVSGGATDNFYQLVLKEPLAKGNKPLAGRKIRGNVFYKPLVVPLGGSLVNLDGGEIYSALQKGVVDGAAWPVLGAVNFKWYEVAKYMVRPRFGLSPFSVSMNMDRFKKLSKADQALVLKVGRMVEDQAPKLFDAEAEKEIAQLKKLGMKETTIEPALFKKVYNGFLKGVWNLAVNFNKKTKARAQKLYDMAKKNGDAPE